MRLSSQQRVAALAPPTPRSAAKKDGTQQQQIPLHNHAVYGGQRPASRSSSQQPQTGPSGTAAAMILNTNINPNANLFTRSHTNNTTSSSAATAGAATASAVPFSRTASAVTARRTASACSTPSYLRGSSSSGHLSFAADPCEGPTLLVPRLQEVLRNASLRGNVTSLSLQGNRLSRSAVQLLCEQIRAPTCRLTSLGLAFCGLGDAASVLLVEACARQRQQSTSTTTTAESSRLHTLDLTMNGITPAGAQRIAGALCAAAQAAAVWKSGHVPLQSLVLRFNRLDAAAVLALLRAPGFLVLDLRYCAIDATATANTTAPATAPAAALLEQGVSEARTVRHLHLDGNNIPAPVVQRLEEALGGNTGTALRDVSATALLGVLPAASAYVLQKNAGQAPYPPAAVAEVERVAGETVVIRGRLRDVAPTSTSSDGSAQTLSGSGSLGSGQRSRSGSAQPPPRRSSSVTSRPECLAVSTSPAGRCRSSLGSADIDHAALETALSATERTQVLSAMGGVAVTRGCRIGRSAIPTSAPDCPVLVRVQEARRETRRRLAAESLGGNHRSPNDASGTATNGDASPAASPRATLAYAASVSAEPVPIVVPSTSISKQQQQDAMDQLPSSPGHLSVAVQRRVIAAVSDFAAPPAQALADSEAEFMAPRLYRVAGAKQGPVAKNFVSGCGALQSPGGGSILTGTSDQPYTRTNTATSSAASHYYDCGVDQNSPKYVLSSCLKAPTARRYLEVAAADDDGCLAVLGFRSDAEGLAVLAAPDCGMGEAMPAAFLPYCPLPSSMVDAAMDGAYRSAEAVAVVAGAGGHATATASETKQALMISAQQQGAAASSSEQQHHLLDDAAITERRLGGLAKLLWLIHFLPGPRVLLDAAVRMSPLPRSLRAAPTVIQTRFLSLRAVELSLAQRFFNQVLARDERDTKRHNEAAAAEQQDHAEHQGDIIATRDGSLVRFNTLLCDDNNGGCAASSPHYARPLERTATATSSSPLHSGGRARSSSWGCVDGGDRNSFHSGGTRAASPPTNATTPTAANIRDAMIANNARKVQSKHKGHYRDIYVPATLHRHR